MGISILAWLSSRDPNMGRGMITRPIWKWNLIHGEVYSIKHYVIMFVSNLRQVRNFLHQYIWQPRYNWNIVESGVKKHKPNHAIYNIVYSTVKMTLHIWYFCVLCMTPYNIVQYIFLSVFRFQSLKWPLNT
jgi:hypothetical protein